MVSAESCEYKPFPEVTVKLSEKNPVTEPSVNKCAHEPFPELTAAVSEEEPCDDPCGNIATKNPSAVVGKENLKMCRGKEYLGKKNLTEERYVYNGKSLHES